MRALKYTFLGISLLLNFSCQKDSEVISQTAEQNSIVSTNMMGLLSRMSQSPTALDNVLDGTNNYRVLLPVNITINEVPLAVKSAADYEAVKALKIINSNVDDLVKYEFPIKIQFQNYRIQTIFNDKELKTINESFKNNNDDSSKEINCMSMNYPVKMNTYNPSNQLAQSMIVKNNEVFYNFIKNVDKDVLVSVNYPITLNNANGVEVSVDENKKLIQLIENEMQKCID